MRMEGLLAFLLIALNIALLSSPATAAMLRSSSFGWPSIPSTPSHFHKLGPSPSSIPTPTPDLLPCGSSPWSSPSPSQSPSLSPSPSPASSLPCIPFPYRRNGPWHRLPNLPAAPVRSRRTFPPFRFPTLPHSLKPFPLEKVNHG